MRRLDFFDGIGVVDHRFEGRRVFADLGWVERLRLRGAPAKADGRRGEVRTLSEAGLPERGRGGPIGGGRGRR